MSNKAISEKTFILLVLKLINGVGPATLWKVKDVEDLESKNYHDILSEIYKYHDTVTADDIAIALSSAEWQKEIAMDGGDKIISYFDDEYPEILFKDSKKKVPLLYCRGDISLLKKEIVAVIGTRKPTGYSIEKTKEVTHKLVQEGKVVLSGLAEGIDTVAHESTLKVGGKTIAVIGTNLSRVYPTSNALLSKEIGEKGLIVSTIPYFESTGPYEFVARDYIQSALSKELMLIQTGTQGGSLHAVKGMLGLNRPVFVMTPPKEESDKDQQAFFGNTVLLNKNEEILKCLFLSKSINVDCISCF